MIDEFITKTLLKFEAAPKEKSCYFCVALIANLLIILGH